MAFYLAKYNTQTVIQFPMIKRGVVDFAVTGDWTPATGDTKVSKDQGNFANAANNPAAVGGTGSAGWSLTISATELQCAEFSIQIIDSATKAVEDQWLTVYTYGNASAKFPFDFNDTVRGGLTALPNAAANAAGGLPISAAGALDLDEMNVDIEAIQTSTAGLTFTVSNQVDVNVLDWKSATAPAMTGDAYARLGAPAGASASADIAAVKVDTAAVKAQTDKLAFTVTNQVDANVLDWKSATAPAMTGDAFARLGAPVGASISADVAGVPAAIIALAYEGAETIQTFLRLARSALVGKLSGAATATVTTRDAADTKARITATVDADGNRSAVTVDGT